MKTTDLIDWKCPRCGQMFYRVKDPGPQGVSHRCQDRRGFGDTIKATIEAATMGKVKTCSPCQRRREKLNQALPFVEPTRFIKTEELVARATDIAAKIPPGSTIFAIARSGMIPASVIASLVHGDLHTVNIKDGSVEHCGSGLRKDDAQEIKTPYIVDDSAWSGSALSTAKEILLKKYGEPFQSAVIFCRSSAKKHVDLFSCIMNTHFFEWNIANTSFAENYVWDLDGTLCDDFMPFEDDDGVAYLRAMKKRIPTHFKPHRRPVNIVTARLDKYRQPTEEWLEDNGFNVANLHMGPWQTQAERTLSEIVMFKSEVIHNNDYKGLVESDREIAHRVYMNTGVWTICNTSGELFIPQGHK